MQRVCNYGSFLQAYGLKKMIEEQGHEVVFVDYKAGKPATPGADMNKYRMLVLREKIMHFAAEMSGLLFFATEEQKRSLGFQKRYRHEFLPVLRISKKQQYNTEVDTLVIGSDEVFNCLQLNPNVGFAPELFGKNRKSKKLISYAASFGNTNIENLELAGKTAEVAALLSDFDAISVRDENSGNIVKELTQKEVSFNLDPVLMYDFSKENLPQVKDTGYIVVYAYRNRLSKEEMEAIRAFADKENKPLISIGGYQGFCDRYVDGTPFEILSYIKNADYVITDTFHGTIFSVINHRKFVTFIRRGNGKIYGNYEKLIDLLKRLNLTDRAAFSPTDIEAKIYSDIDYGAVEEIIKAQREKTAEYLKNNL